MKNYVGRKIRGFRYKDNTDGLKWIEEITSCIGKIGEIKYQHSKFVGVFIDGYYWQYPISLVDEHLVEEFPEISGLEALLIVHGGWHGKEEEMLYDKCFKIIQQERKRLQSIYIKTIPKYTHAELVEKLGHDFEIIE
jgi:hypothetical protein